MRKRVNKKLIVALLSFVLLFGGTFGSSLAWLFATTTDVKNTFSTSDIEVKLEETTTDYKIIPGWTVPKDPKVTITKGSVDCYVFVKIEKSTNYSTYLEQYKVADDWIPLKNGNDDVEGVFYQEVKNLTENDWSAYVLKGKHEEECTDNEDCSCPNKNGYVTVLGSVTKTQMDDLKKATTDENKLTLTFTAYASQLMKDNDTEFTPIEAWNNLTPTNP